jgi:acetoin utilization protein AcuB/CBS domain-containing protein
MLSTTKTSERRRERSTEQEIRFWMSSPAILVSRSAPIGEALRLIREHNVRRLPVIAEDERICGIITYGDIRGTQVLRALDLGVKDLADALERITVDEVMTTAPITISPTTALRDAGRLMVENKVSGLPVLDDMGNVIGIITESDVFEVLVYCLHQEVLEAWDISKLVVEPQPLDLVTG